MHMVNSRGRDKAGISFKRCKSFLYENKNKNAKSMLMSGKRPTAKVFVFGERKIAKLWKDDAGI